MERAKNGFTLIEVLASIIIIGIILTVFFGFYSQSMLFSNKNQQQLEALNIAREVLVHVQEKTSYNSEYTKNNTTYYVSVTDITPSTTELKDLTNSNLPPFGLYFKEISIYSLPSRIPESLLAKTFAYQKGGP